MLLLLVGTPPSLVVGSVAGAGSRLVLEEVAGDSVVAGDIVDLGSPPCPAHDRRSNCLSGAPPRCVPEGDLLAAASPCEAASSEAGIVRAGPGSLPCPPAATRFSPRLTSRPCKGALELAMARKDALRSVPSAVHPPVAVAGVGRNGAPRDRRWTLNSVACSSGGPSSPRPARPVPDPDLMRDEKARATVSAPSPTSPPDSAARRKILNKSAKCGIRLSEEDARNFLDFVRSAV